MPSFCAVFNYSNRTDREKKSLVTVFPQLSEIMAKDRDFLN